MAIGLMAVSKELESTLSKMVHLSKVNGLMIDLFNTRFLKMYLTSNSSIRISHLYHSTTSVSIRETGAMVRLMVKENCATMMAAFLKASLSKVFEKARVKLPT